MASSRKKPSKAKNDDNLPTKADVVDAVLIDEDGNTVEPTVPSEDQDSSAVDRIADAVSNTETDPSVDAEPSEPSEIESADAKPEPEKTVEPSQSAQASPTAVAPKSNTFLPLVMGGVIAAALGFFAAEYLLSDDTSPLETQVEANRSRVTDLTAQLGDATAQLEASQEERAQLIEQVSTLEADLAALAEQVNEVPDVGDAELPADLAALLAAQKEEIAALQGNLREMATFAEGQIQSAQEEAEAAARAEARALARDRLNTVRLALASGAPFEDVLPAIADATEVPPALSDVAASGVPTQSELQSEFEPAARRALAASNRALAGNTPGDRVGLFLQDMIGARSLTPQEGDSPDAVLSRAEANVQNGDLGAALETIQALPEEGLAELNDWTEKARARNEALQGFSDLTGALSAD